MCHSLCSVMGESTVVPRSIELGVGLDVVLTWMKVACNVDGSRMSDGEKTRTINGGTVGPHIAPVCIDLVVGKTSVPSAEVGRDGAVYGLYEDKTGTCVLVINIALPSGAWALVGNSSGEEGCGPKTVTVTSNNGCMGSGGGVAGGTKMTTCTVAV